MESIWRRESSLRPREPLNGDISADVAVVGGGMAGILTAYFLKRRGINAVVLEASRIGSGQTGNTTAKITSQHGMIYHRMMEVFGEQKAKQYAQANQQAIRDYRELVEELHIHCDFTLCPSYLYALANREGLEQEAEAAKKLGLPAEIMEHTELPFPVKGALRFENQAQFDPLRFLQAVAEPLTIYEQTPVQKIEDHRLITSGGTVEAKKIVMATHFPFVSVPGYYFMRMHQQRSYVLALEGAPKLNGMYYCGEEGGYSFRSAGKYLLFGGAGHRTGENKEGGRYEELRKEARRLYPHSKEAFAWSAQDCMPDDGVPLIGLFSSAQPDWFVATGFQKWGMSTSMAAARLLCQAIAGEEPDWGEVFSPQRFNLAAAGAAMLEDGMMAVKGLGKTLFHIPSSAAEELLPGHGGIVSLEGEKMGVYKDEEGRLFAVQARCPHLGCELSWNPDEKSWDCPCHGSRFDYCGNLLDNPAQEGLKRE